MPSSRGRRHTKKIDTIHADNMSIAQSYSFTHSKKGRPTEGVKGEPSDLEGFKALQKPVTDRNLSRIGDLKRSYQTAKSLTSMNGKPQSSVPMAESTFLSSDHVTSASPTPFEIAFRIKTSDSILDGDYAYLALTDPEITTYADHLGLGNKFSGHAGNEANQWGAVRGRSANQDPVSPGIRLSDRPEISRGNQRERLCEGCTNTDLPAAKICSSNSAGSVGDSVSRSQCTTTTTDSVKKRKPKSAEQIERARDRRRLARRAKRAAKAHHTTKDPTALDDDVASDNSGEGILNAKASKRDDSLGPLLESEEDELRRMLQPKVSALQASHQRELQKVRLQFAKDFDENLGVISRFLRASRAYVFDNGDPQRVSRAALGLFVLPEHVAVRTMKKLIAVSDEGVQAVDRRGLPIHDCPSDSNVTCKSIL